MSVCSVDLQGWSLDMAEGMRHLLAQEREGTVTDEVIVEGRLGYSASSH